LGAQREAEGAAARTAEVQRFEGGVGLENIGKRPGALDADEIVAED